MRRIMFLAAGFAAAIALAGCASDSPANSGSHAVASVKGKVATKQDVVAVMQGFAATAFNRSNREASKCFTIYGVKQSALTSKQHDLEQQCYTDSLNVDAAATLALRYWRAMKIPSSMRAQVAAMEPLLEKFNESQLVQGCGNDSLPTIDKASCYKPLDDQFFTNAANVEVLIEQDWRSLGVNSTVL